MNQTLGLKVRVVLVDLTEELLDANVLLLLLASLHVSPHGLEVDLEHLIGDGKLSMVLVGDLASSIFARA